MKNGDAKPRVYNCKRSHDSQVAEEKSFERLRKPGDITRLVFWNLIIRSFDKGKPVEKRGRKAKDLKLHISAVMIAWLPKRDPNFAGSF